MLLIVALVRWAAPTGERRPFRLVTPGRLVTVASLVTTAGFNVYVTYLASYNATYGAFTAAIILMLWIWMAGSCSCSAPSSTRCSTSGRRRAPRSAVDEPDVAGAGHGLRA